MTLYDRLLSHKDVQCDVTYDYRYDLISRLTAMDTSEGQKLRIAYDDKNRPNGQSVRSTVPPRRLVISMGMQPTDRSRD
ncbi:MAG: hypothetical protein V8S08_09355 [Lachnoclostridium sp.]